MTVKFVDLDFGVNPPVHPLTIDDALVISFLFDNEELSTSTCYDHIIYFAEDLVKKSGTMESFDAGTMVLTVVCSWLSPSEVRLILGRRGEVPKSFKVKTKELIEQLRIVLKDLCNHVRDKKIEDFEKWTRTIHEEWKSRTGLDLGEPIT